MLKEFHLFSGAKTYGLLGDRIEPRSRSKENASCSGRVTLKTPTATARYIARQIGAETKNLASGEKSIRNACCTTNPNATAMSPAAVCGPTTDSTSFSPIPNGRPE